MLNHYTAQRRKKAWRGVTLVELLIVVTITLLLASIAIPNISRAVANARIRSSASALAGVIQDAKIVAAKSNKTYDVRYSTSAGIQIAYVDLNLNGSWDTGEPVVNFSNSVSPAAAAPTGSGGQPSAYTSTADCGGTCGTPYDNTATLAFSARGLPCLYDTSTTPATCSTPAANYFVYYLRDSASGKWAGVQVTKAGRTRILIWNGSQWSD